MLRSLEAPHPRLLPHPQTRDHINAGLSLRLDKKRGSRQRHGAAVFAPLADDQNSLALAGLELLQSPIDALLRMTGWLLVSADEDDVGFDVPAKEIAIDDPCLACESLPQLLLEDVGALVA